MRSFASSSYTTTFFFTEFCDPSLYEEIEMDTDSLYIALGRPSLVESFRPQMLDKWNQYRSLDCRDCERFEKMGSTQILWTYHWTMGKNDPNKMKSQN